MAVLKGFMKFAVLAAASTPPVVVIREFDAAPIRGEKLDDKPETAALEDDEILELLDAEKCGAKMRNVITTLVAFGGRPGECEN